MGVYSTGFSLLFGVTALLMSVFIVYNGQLLKFSLGISSLTTSLLETSIDVDRATRASVVNCGRCPKNLRGGGGGADEDWPRVSPGKMDNIGHSTL